MTGWLSEVQNLFDALKESTAFWVIGGACVVLVLASFVRGLR